jgi:Skp family chaperone for outer membrane proteins
MRVLDACLSSDKAAMEDESGIVEPERPRRPSVTNINIFALAPVAASHANMAQPVLEPDESTETLVSPEWLERRNKRLDTLEQELRRRAADLAAREAELEQREAELEAEAFIRSEALEEREQRLTELDQRLGRRENELGSYIARVQGGMLRADAL